MTSLPMRWLVGTTFVWFSAGLPAQDADVSETKTTISDALITTSSNHKERVIRAPATSQTTKPEKAGKPFEPSERIQFDSAVAFPTDI